MPLNSKFMLTALAILLLAQVGLAQTTKPPRAPNIVLIISDDQAWTDYGFMGHEFIRTPRLDQLARESAVFRRGYIPTALCRPSLATLVTGRYAHQHRICGNDPALNSDLKSSEGYGVRREQLIARIDSFDTLPKLLAERGYLSMQSGKWWEGSFSRGGFTHGMTRGFPNPGGRHGDDGLAIGRTGLKPVLDFVDQAVEKQQPFFVWYAPLLPHEPHTPPQRLLNNYAVDGRPLPVAKYWAMCEWFDETCGQLLDYLDEKQLRENTLVIYVTDNGWTQLAEHSNRGSFAERSKQSPYENGTRTPIMFRWPSVVTPADREELCSSIDIMPTILAAAQARQPVELPGLNLLPAIRDGSTIQRDAIFGEVFSHDVADVEQPEASLIYRWVIRGQWKLLLTYDGPLVGVKFPPKDFRPQLYDLLADPTEKDNLAATHPDIVSELAVRLNAWYPVEKRKTVTAWSDQPVKLRPN